MHMTAQASWYCYPSHVVKISLPCRYSDTWTRTKFWTNSETVFWKFYITFIFTVRNSTCGQVMFLQVSVHGAGGCTTPRQTDTPPTETATVVDGNHPTGMQSCLQLFLNNSTTYFNKPTGKPSADKSSKCFCLLQCLLMLGYLQLSELRFLSPCTQLPSSWLFRYFFLQQRRFNKNVFR